MIEMLNAWAAEWTVWMATALVEGTALLIVAGGVWFFAARRASAQFGYLLFLLVLARLAVPAIVAVPAAWAWLSPRYAIGQAGAWLHAAGDDRGEDRPRRSAAEEAPEFAGPPLSAEALAAHADLLPRAAANEDLDQLAPKEALSPSAWLMALWASVVAALAARLAWEQVQWKRRVAGAKALGAAELSLDFPELTRRLGIRRRVAIVESAAVESPAVCDLFRPRLILPPGLAERLPREQLAWVLAHELAHVRRGDLWVVLAQRWLQIVYFFHPAVWLANRAVDRQREYACDDAALAAAGCRGRECGSALVAVAAWAFGRSPRPALGLFHSPTVLKRRVTRLIDAKPGATPRLSPASLALLIAAAILVLPHVRAAEPQAAVKPEPKTAARDEAAPRQDAKAAAPKPAERPGTQADAPQATPSLEARAAAIKAIQQAGGFLEPDFEKARAAGEIRDLYNPKYDFVGARLASPKAVDEVLANLEAFPELERLDLSATAVTEAGLDHVGRLKNLMELKLNSTPTTDRGLSRLAALTKLQALDLSKTKVTSLGVEWLALLENLRFLKLDDTTVGDDGLKRLAPLEKLVSVELTHTEVTDAGLAHLSDLASLKRVRLGRDEITDAGLAHLGRLVELEWLDLSDTQITDAGFRQLDPLRNLTTLSLNNTRIGDASATALAGRPDLSDLALRGTALTDAGLAKLAGLTKLWGLDLSETQITDEGLKSLAGFKELRWLSLENTAITDAGLVRLKPLVSLQHLNLNGTKVDDPRLEPLSALSGLTKLEVRNTPITAFDVHRALPQTNTNVQRILRALDDKTELEFVDQPLSDVVEYLRERHEIEIQLDNRSLTDAGKGSDTPITISVRNLPLNDALKQMLGKYGLEKAIRHDLLMIGAKPLPKEVPSIPILPAGQRISPKLGTALGEKTELEFVDQPLSDIVEYLKERHHIEIVLDNKGLADAGLGSDTPVTRNIKGITLKSALELMLGEMDLTCFAEGDRLVVRPIPGE